MHRHCLDSMITFLPSHVTQWLFVLPPPSEFSILMSRPGRGCPCSAAHSMESSFVICCGVRMPATTSSPYGGGRPRGQGAAKNDDGGKQREIRWVKTQTALWWEFRDRGVGSARGRCVCNIRCTLAQIKRCIGWGVANPKLPKSTKTLRGEASSNPLLRALFLCETNNPSITNKRY